MRRWSYLLLVAVSLRLPAQTSQPASDIPLLADLLAPLDAGRVQHGTPIFLKVHKDWSSGTCHLPIGATVAGHVIDVSPVTQRNRDSAITVDFNLVDCAGVLTPMRLSLATIVNMPPVLLGRSTDFEDASNVLNADPLVGVSASEAMAQSSLATSTLGHYASAESRIPTKITPGQVIGLPGLTLAPAPESASASVLTRPKHNVHLDKSTLLIFLPAGSSSLASAEPVTAVSLAAAATGKSVVSSKPEPSTPLPEIDLTSICSDPCSSQADTGIQQLSPTLRQIATVSLGYRQRDASPDPLFGFESSLIYLDPHNLLFTFDPHKLRQRRPLGFDTESMKTVRAVLLDPATLKVKRVEDWQVQNEGQYLWRVGDSGVLVHTGHRLRFLAGSPASREIPVPGKLVFLSVSPSGNRIAIGVQRERHTRQSHFGMKYELGVDPEEDVEVQLFDRDLKPLLHVTQSTSAPAPVLSDDGQLLLTALGKAHWRITEQRWNGAQHTVANFQSNCKPALSTPARGIVFIIGCTSSFENWYRVLRMDGHLLFTGAGSAVHTEECFSDAQGDIAIRTLRSFALLSAAASYDVTSFRGQRISLYRPKDRKLLFSVENPDVSFARQSFAISPDGSQLAVLSRGALSLYALNH